MNITPTKHDVIIIGCCVLLYGVDLLTIFAGGRHLLLYGSDAHFALIFSFGAFLLAVTNEADKMNKTLSGNALVVSVLSQCVATLMASGIVIALYVGY